jgi:voltage-gated potassium channel
MTTTRLDRWERALNIPITGLTVAFLAAYAWPILQPNLRDSWVTACSVTVWGVWLILAIDLAIRLYIAPDRWAFVKHNLIDVLSVILPILRPLRLLRLVTMLARINRFAGRSLHGRIALYLVGAVTLLVFVSSVAVLDAERDGPGRIQTLGDSLWWSTATITTVGYGDVAPVTFKGRCVAVALMLSGIAVLGVVTASIASWLIEQVAEDSRTAKGSTSADIAELRSEIELLRQDLRSRPQSDHEDDSGSRESRPDNLPESPPF